MTVTHMHTPGKDVDKGGSSYVYATCVICSRKIRRWTGSEGAQWEVLAEAKQPVVATATVATLAVPKDVKDAIDDDQLAAVARSANAWQVGGTHYQDNAVQCPHCGGTLQHWDIYKFFPYIEGVITKYLWRWRDKNGVQDLDKARHYLDKLFEVASGELMKPKPQHRTP